MTMHHRSTNRIEHLSHHDHRNHGIHHRNNNNHNHNHNNNDNDFGNGTNGHYTQQPQSSTTPTDAQPFLNHSTAPRRHPPTATAEGDESKNERFIETMIKIFIGLFAITAFSISYNVSSGNGIAGYYSGVGGRGGDGTSSISRRNGNTYMGANVVGKLRTPSDGSKDQLQSRYESHSDSPLPLQSQQSQPTTPSKQILYPLPHSYPAHWPSYRLPGWATKTYDSIDAFDPSTDIPDGKRVCFVHVGKTAGSTVGCALGFHLHCGGDGSAFAAVRPVDPSREEEEEEEGDGRGGNETVAVWEEPYRRRLPSSSSSSSSSGRHNAPGLLAKYTTNIFHTNIYDCPDPISPNDTHRGKDYGREATNYYLFLVRNPLHRLLSAHAYDRPSNWEGFQNGMTGYYDRRKKLYADCPFTTLEDLARLGLGDDENGVGTVSEECRTRAREAVLGTSHFGCHFYYNYQYHWEGIPNHLIDEGLVKIVTIRTEHLERDWNSIEVELGGGEEYIFMGGPSPSSSQPQQQQTLHNNVNTKALHTDKYLSYESKSLLCHYLCNEIQIYKLILSKSLNLDEREIRRSIDELKQDCPLQADLAECPAALPNGKTKLLLDRGYGTERGEEWKSPPKREPTPTYVTKKIVRPYEAHWGLPLPSYMKKDYEKYLSIVPEDQRVCFVHVGKTAGSSVGCALGFRLHCGTDGDGVGVEEDGLSRTIGTNETTAAAKSSRLATPGLLPQYSTHMFHAQIYDCFDRSAHYLFVVRNPLHRLISAYNYDKPRDWERSKTKNPRYYEMTKALYVDCGFDTLEDLASNGLSPQGNSSGVCRERAASSILGTGRFGNHIYYNYQFHLEAVPKGANILVLRTEHLAEDWNAAERFVSGRENILGDDQAVFPHNNVNSNSDVKAKHLTDESRVLVCEKLCNEIQVYKKILSSATNLNEEQMKLSLEELKESCPVEAMAATCRDPLPDITEKLVKGRGYEKETIPKPFTGEISVGREVYSQPPHPYELAWPKLRLPSYMRKDPEYDLNLAPKDKKTCFVHVGKTAGSTIGCAIGFNLHCATKIKAPGLLPLYATNMFHAQMYDCHDDSAYFVFVVRHPLDRLVSAFNYDKPSDWDDFRKRFGEKHYNFRKRLYRDCPFESMEDVARLGLSNRGTASGECMRRAAASIEGTEHFGCHSYFNYQFHLEAVPENATLMTIRTEHLVEDYNSVEYHLGGEPHVLGPNQTVLAHNNENKAIGEELKHLSEESKKLVCDKLCNEIQVYKEILRRSINLSEEQVEESIRELSESCPRETEAVSCVQPLPDITDKLVNSRGYISSKKGRRRGKSEMERNVGMN